jgi:TonB family protein
MGSARRNINSISRVNAILGTIIIHLFLGIAIYASKISSMQTREIEVKVETPESIKQEQEEAIKEKERLRSQMIQMNEKLDAYIAGQQRRNIGVNMSEDKIVKSEKDLQETQKEIENAQKQIQEIQENLDKTKDIKYASSSDGEPVSEVKTQKPEGKLAVYKGPTNIYYSLEKRNTVDLYVPVYKCPSLGKVVVLITVDREGNVTDAKIDKSKSDPDPCLLEAGRDAALRSKFNSDNTAPQSQSGSITYLFVSQ